MNSRYIDVHSVRAIPLAFLAYSNGAPRRGEFGRAPLLRPLVRWRRQEGRKCPPCHPTRVTQRTRLPTGAVWRYSAKRSRYLEFVVMNGNPPFNNLARTDALSDARVSSGIDQECPRISVSFPLKLPSPVLTSVVACFGHHVHARCQPHCRAVLGDKEHSAVIYREGERSGHRCT